MSKMVRTARTCALAGLMALAGSLGAVAGPKLVLGGGGWQLERFEGDVVVLRTTVSASAAGRPGLLVLSCAGAEHRVSLALPQAIASAERARRSISIRPAGRPMPGETPLIATFALEQGRLLTFTEFDSGPSSVVLRLADLLRQRPPALDMLAHPGGKAIAVRAVVPHVLSLTFDGNDGIALDGFIAACVPPAR